ncbi:hypothetical protein BSKO_01686 [Bryopsis sp. KO-2023]|nr:hypothetical protein BSKO_01686 [Bryopsis sp. KO-2023]
MLGCGRVRAGGNTAEGITSFKCALNRSGIFLRSTSGSRHWGAGRFRQYCEKRGSESIVTEGGDVDPRPTLEETLAKAHEAAELAEEAVEKVDTLPSAYPEPLIPRLIKSFLVESAQLWLLLFNMATHFVGGWLQWLGGGVGALAISALVYRKGSLSKSGMIAAWFVGFGSLGASLRCGITLLAFFFSSSKLTKLKESVKAEIDADFKKGGQRNWVQVLCNGGIPTVLAVASSVMAGCKDLPLSTEWSRLGTFLLGCFLGYYSCCCGDTWASEVGVLSKGTPRLIISGRPVRKGVNGGVTLLGLTASVAGGLFIGLTFYLTGFLSSAAGPSMQGAPAQWPLIGLGVLGGFVGSVVDSLLGATVQYSGFDQKLQKVVNRPGDPEQVFQISGSNILSNNQVNLVSASLTALLIGRLTLRIF